MSGRILITGCSGFIGSHLMSALAGRFDCLGVDAAAPAFVPRNWTFAQCDIVDGGKLSAIVAGFKPEAIYHLAARTDLNGVNLQSYAANVAGTRNVIQAIIASGGVRRALFTSSQLVCRIGYRPVSDTDYCPVNFYGESKVLTEKIVRAEMPPDVSWCILRPTTIWGEGMSVHYQRFLSLVQKRRYFHIGNSPLRKSYGYVGNTVYQYIAFMNAPEAEVDRRTFYVADYEALSLRRWIDELARALGASKPVTMPVGLARGLGKCGDLLNGLGLRSFPFNSFRIRNILTEYILDLAPTKQVCGPLPFSIDQGVERTARWYRELTGTTPS